MAGLDHPLKEAIEGLRRAILALDPAIAEEIKWKAPSFKLDDHFATFKLYPPRQIQIVLHRGAKVKPVDKTYTLPDPHGLLKWPAPDRCVLTLKSGEQAQELTEEVCGMIKMWIAQL